MTPEQRWTEIAARIAALFALHAPWTSGAWAIDPITMESVACRSEEQWEVMRRGHARRLDDLMRARPSGLSRAWRVLWEEARDSRTLSVLRRAWHAAREG